MDGVSYDLAIVRMGEPMAAAARERRANVAAPRDGVLARLRALLAVH